MLTLVRRSFGRVAVAWVAGALVLAGFQAAIVAAAVSLEESGDFKSLVNAVPAFVREMMYPALASFSGMSALAFFEPLVILLVTLFAIYVASEPAGDVESGIVDLVLARPVPRHWVISRSLVLMAATTGAFGLTLAATNRLALLWMAPAGAAWPTSEVVTLMTVHLCAVGWCFGGLTLGAAGAMPRRTAVLGVMIVATIALYLLEVLVNWSTMFEPFWWVTPFHYFHGTEIITGTSQTARNLIVLGSLGIIGAAAGYWQFNRRDV